MKKGFLYFDINFVKNIIVILLGGGGVNDKIFSIFINLLYDSVCHPIKIDFLLITKK